MERTYQITEQDNGLLILAPAKINLSLLIAGRRSDGFHDIETVMAKIDVYDEVLIEPGTKHGIELICKGHWSPQGRENLVWRAAKAVIDVYSPGADLRITLTKNISAGTGLGSASSDAAATLAGLNKFLDLNLTTVELLHIAANLGSDIAFFLFGPLCFCSGRGEKIRQLDKIFDFSALLILPNTSCSTASVYENYIHDEIKFNHLKAEIDVFIEKNRIDLLSKMCANMLQISCFGLYEGLADLKSRLESLVRRPVCLSGSGSSMFVMFDSRDEASDVGCKIEDEIGCNSFAVSNNGW